MANSTNKCFQERINPLRPKYNLLNFAEDIFQSIYLYEAFLN